jgi:hypothetical protein
MDALVASLEGISFRTDVEQGFVQHDAYIIVQCHIKSVSKQCYQCIPYHLCKMERKLYPSSALLYKDLAAALTEIGYGQDLLELMPYIDDYLSNFA